MAEATTAETPKPGNAIKQVKTRTRKAASHLRAVTTEPMVEAEDAAEDRVASLREQISELAQQVDTAEDRLDDARDLVASVADAGTVLAARAGRQTLATARAVRNDPLPLIVGLGVVALPPAAMVVGGINRRS